MEELTKSEKNQMQFKPVIFSLEPHPLHASLTQCFKGETGKLEQRHFPDGESYLRILNEVHDKNCIVIADLSHPNSKYLPLVFLLETLREFGARTIGLVAPYLSYMRQDRRFVEGEAITSKVFAKCISLHIDWLVTVDPHLHRYHSLDEIYSVPSKVVQGAPALADWLGSKKNLLLVGPDEESEQWVSEISNQCGHPYVIGKKNRMGDRNVKVSLPDIKAYLSRTAMIIDDVISSGQTIIQCAQELEKKGMTEIQCAAVHGIFADKSDELLIKSGLKSLITTNTIQHSSNAIDITPLLIDPIKSCIKT